MKLLKHKSLFHHNMLSYCFLFCLYRYILIVTFYNVLLVKRKPNTGIFQQLFTQLFPGEKYGLRKNIRKLMHWYEEIVETIKLVFQTAYDCEYYLILYIHSYKEVSDKKIEYDWFSGNSQPLNCQQICQRSFATIHKFDDIVTQYVPVGKCKYALHFFPPLYYILYSYSYTFLSYVPMVNQSKPVELSKSE